MITTGYLIWHYYVTSNINDLNLKLQGKSKLFPSLVNDINAFNMKLKMFISQLENEDLCQFPHIKEQSECAADHRSLAKNTAKITLLQVSLECCFHDHGKEEDCILNFINPFSHSEQKIMKIPCNKQMELIDFKTNSALKTKFAELFSAANSSEMIQFWRSLPSENFREKKIFAQRAMSSQKDI